MPSSNLYVWPRILHLVAEAVAPLDTPAVLDVGPGCGKGGLLLREYVRRDLRVDAVEAEQRYLEQHEWLWAIYDVIYHDDVCNLSTATLGEYDVVLLGDVLEHLDQDAGCALLERIPGFVVIATPRDFFQNPEADQGWPTERHRSQWSAETIAAVRPVDREEADAPDTLGAVIVRCPPL